MNEELNSILNDAEGLVVTLGSIQDDMRKIGQSQAPTIDEIENLYAMANRINNYLNK